MSPFFRGVCGYAQGLKLFIGDAAHKKLLETKQKQQLREEFAKDLVWFPVVATIYGALVTYDAPDEPFVRVAYLDIFGSSPAEREGGWSEDPASLDAEAGKKWTRLRRNLQRSRPKNQNGHWPGASQR